MENNRVNMASIVKVKIVDIAEYNKVYNLIKEIQKDRFADVMYPNAYRLSEIVGYDSEYKRKNEII